MRLCDKVAIITGASKGIGAEIAKSFAKEGAKVVIASRTMNDLQNVKAEIEEFGVECLVLEADVRKREEVIALAEKTYEHFGSIDVIVNNAGYPMFGFAVDDENVQAEERYQAIMETNLRGYWYTTRFAVPYMKKNKRGSIINISSVRGFNGIPNDSAYCAAKGGVNMLTRSLAVEMAPFNIRVNTISPGAIQVDLGHWILSRFGEDAHRTYVERFKDVHEFGMKITQPLRTIGCPEDVAHAAVYFASEESRFVTGANLIVDGGLTSLMAEPGALDLASLNEYYEMSAEMREWFSQLE